MIDIGVNLTNSQLAAEAAEILERAQQADIQHCVITGTDADASQQALRLTQDLQEQFPAMLSCTAGVHPHDAKSWNADTECVIRELLASPSVVAVGETGLDFNRNFSPPDTQIAAFEAQIEIASDIGKPMFLHERDAFEQQIDMLQNHRDDISDAVIHCFTGDKKSLFAYLDLDLYIGITGWVCDERRGRELADIVHNIPLDRLMVETDAPYLLPRNVDPKPKSRINEPCYLRWVVDKVAECYDVPASTIAEASTATAKRFFRLD